MHPDTRAWLAPTPGESSTIEHETYLTTREVAAYIKCGEHTVKKMRADGSGPPFVRLGKRPNGRIRYRRSTVDKWMREQETSK